MSGGYQPQGGNTPALPTTGSGVKPAHHGAAERDPQRDFINRLKILRSLDSHELFSAGAISANDLCGFTNQRKWQKFQADPIGFMMKCDDSTADAIWLALEKRSAR